MWTTAVLAFVLAFSVLCIRNLDPIVYPTLYAEDGEWTANLLTYGFFDTSFSTRVFPILGFVIFYAVGNGVAGLLFDDPVFYLPLVYYFLSNLFMAGLAVVAFVRLRQLVSGWAVFAVFISIVLLPVGTDGNEIYGRILNLGFFFPYLQVILLLPVLGPDRTRLQMAAAIFFSLISGLTFPVGMGLSIIAAGVLLLRHLLSGRAKSDVLLSAMFLLVGLLPLFFLSVETFSNQGGADLPFKAESFVEFAVARAALYPLVFQVYELLSDGVVLSIAALVAILGCAGLYAAKANGGFAKESKDGFGYVLLALWGASAVYLLAMVAMRSGLTSAFDGYTGTFPDRYFTGLNLTVFTALVCSVDRLRMGHLVCALLSVPFLMTAAERIELDKPSVKFQTVRPWTTELCGAEVRGKNDDLGVPIPPEGWTARLPVSAQTKGLADQCSLSNFYDLPIIRDMRPAVTIQEGSRSGQAVLKISAVDVNNNVELTPIKSGEVAIVVTGGDPGILLNFAPLQRAAEGETRVNLHVKTEEPAMLQLFYLRKSAKGFSEAGSLYMLVPGGGEQFVVVFDSTIAASRMRLDFPDGAGRAYSVGFDPVL